MCQIETKPEFTGVTKKCECCGQELPLSHFQKYASGYRKICNACRRRESGATDKFKDFTSRELIDELKARGYEGQLTKKVIETVKL
jgi:hypothetical protein